MWAAVLAGSVGCYVLKLAGVSVPQRVLANPRVRRIGALLPVALLSALVATQTFSTGQDLMVDARAAGSPSPPSRCWRGRRSWWWLWERPDRRRSSAP